MDIDTAVSRKLQNPLRKYLAECRHDDCIRGKRFQHLEKFIILLHPGRLVNGNTVFHCLLLDGSHKHRFAPALWFIRLGYDGGHLMASSYQRLQSGNCEIRCSHKYNLHLIPLPLPSSHLPVCPPRGSHRAGPSGGRIHDRLPLQAVLRPPAQTLPSFRSGPLLLLSPAV